MFIHMYIYIYIYIYTHIHIHTHGLRTVLACVRLPPSRMARSVGIPGLGFDSMIAVRL